MKDKVESVLHFVKLGFPNADFKVEIVENKINIYCSGVFYEDEFGRMCGEAQRILSCLFMDYEINIT